MQRPMNNTNCIIAIFPAEKNRHFDSDKKVDKPQLHRSSKFFRRFTEIPVWFFWNFLEFQQFYTFHNFQKDWHKLNHKLQLPRVIHIFHRVFHTQFFLYFQCFYRFLDFFVICGNAVFNGFKNRFSIYIISYHLLFSIFLLRFSYWHWWFRGQVSSPVKKSKYSAFTCFLRRLWICKKRLHSSRFFSFTPQYPGWRMHSIPYRQYFPPDTHSNPAHRS